MFVSHAINFIYYLETNQKQLIRNQFKLHHYSGQHLHIITLYIIKANTFL